MKVSLIKIGPAFMLAASVFALSGCQSDPPMNAQINRANENITRTDGINRTESAYEGLRDLALDTRPGEIGLKLPGDKTKVYGVVMDYDVGDGVATFTAFQTGDASMYTSRGGGILGGKAHENVKKAAVALVDTAQDFLGKAVPTETTPLPETLGVNFYFLTNKGKFVVRDKLENFENKSSPLIALFEEANKLITELRKTNAKEQKK